MVKTTVGGSRWWSSMPRRTPRGGVGRCGRWPRHDGVRVSASTVLTVLRRRSLVTEATVCQRERRQLAAAAASDVPDLPTGANQVWQLDFSEFERPAAAPGGSPRLA